MSENKERALNPLAGDIGRPSTDAGSPRWNEEITLLEKSEEKKSSFRKSPSFRKSMVRIASEKTMPLASWSKMPPPSLTLSGSDKNNSSVTNALKSLKFIAETGNGKKTWTKVEKWFDSKTDSTGGLLNHDDFGECIGMKEKEFAGQLFDALARKRCIEGKSINKAQLQEFWDLITDQNFDAKLQIFIDMVDKDADGRITKEEIIKIIELSASTNKLSHIKKKAEKYATLIMEELDPDNVGYIEVVILETYLRQALTESKSNMPCQTLKKQDRNRIRMCCTSIKYFLSVNWQRWWLVALWIAVMCGLFDYKYEQYRRRPAFLVMGHCVCMAKGAAETLKLNMALILLPVCRNTVTWLRNKTKLGVAVPFDDNINFHMMIAVAVAIGVGIHAISHLACDFPRLLNAGHDYMLMEPYFGKQPKSYWHFVKSVEGVTGIVMVVLMAVAFTLAMPWFRRGNSMLPEPLKKLTGFNAFWYSHHLFVIVYTLLVIHGFFLYLTKEWYKKTTWMYLAIPVTIYTCERLTRALRSRIEPVKLEKVAVHKKVVALYMRKPDGFKYKSGQYMFVKCSAVSPFEWHPFSITSAPGDDYLSVHIRNLGDWTGKLHQEFEKVCQQLDPKSGESETLIANFLQGNNNSKIPRVRIDGPYGAPAQDYRKYEVVLLVGLGIGATPMISIVRDIMNNIKAKEDEEGNIALENGYGCMSPNPKREDVFKTKKAYFYWVAPEQDSFDWFEGIMNDVAEQDHNHVIEPHIHCTSVYEEGDARSAFIVMLQSLNHAKCGKDIVNGAKVKTHFGRPKWDDVYKNITCEHPSSQVGVFYCGKPVLIKDLRQLASDFSHETGTKFEFHKENF